MFDMGFAAGAGFGAGAGFSDAAGDGLESMYQEVILDAARNPHGKTHFESTDALAKAELQEETQESTESAKNTESAEITLNNAHESCAVTSDENSALGQSHQFNPTCGDEVTMRVELSRSANNDETPIVSSIKWDGHGCSISQASLSMMVDLVEGKSVDEALQLDALFHKLMESRGEGLQSEEDEDALEDAMVLQGVSRYPMRIKCALLAWEGLKDSIAKASQNLNPQILGSL
ncbi:SUF system NifU family Fe-S cluster assembly protein [Gardnerella sp. DNF01162]|uniref:Fe-S cluster assembly sulfur transfer protein SufU n=1 Tax=Gardnerella TaxID=2701 RepID=UPI000C9B0C48|nr:SUF system NifU family Fe-S cluster assembly protein [Gardnerella sp. DNF01162]PMC44660.1 SUF system NifU family Fe-S cluster assembly protein [Gardnerella vaginalis]PNP90785.1 SUF system NifU family Fe-S cluster assembly protein [Gardnerella sp. DNF01162]RFD73373.1 iron-sulfur cluster assembly scaffold protein [Gardnerella vaginalis]RIY28777.1 SUF system NifU family Fe-S cluster assembly protein [Bifidobacteriaceae bacterium NR016]